MRITLPRGRVSPKLIHQDVGFCYISGLGGRLGGAGEQAYLAISPDDGYWWLRGSTGNGSFHISVTAVEDVQW